MFLPSFRLNFLFFSEQQLIEGHKENMTSEEMISENNHQSSATKDDTSSSTVSMI